MWCLRKPIKSWCFHFYFGFRCVSWWFCFFIFFSSFLFFSLAGYDHTHLVVSEDIQLTATFVWPYQKGPHAPASRPGRPTSQSRVP